MDDGKGPASALDGSTVGSFQGWGFGRRGWTCHHFLHETKDSYLYLKNGIKLQHIVAALSRQSEQTVSAVQILRCSYFQHR